MPRQRRKITRASKPSTRSSLAKVATGIDGFDEITGGGLPQGRPTLVCGGPGCGKTLFALQFLVHGAARGESGVFVTFEETEEDIRKNAASLGYDVPGLIDRKRLALEYIRVERSEIEETGEYDLEGLFIRLDHALRTVGARRIVLDTIESLFAGLKNAGVLRAELRRLFA
jgi:circadian clock protein KaiC